MVAGMMLAVMLTSGRSVGSQQEVLESLDAGGTRSVVIRADPTAGLTAAALGRIAQIGGIEWSAGFSAVSDSTNARVPDGIRVPVRLLYTDHLQELGIPTTASGSSAAYASAAALDQLGLVGPVGAVTTVDGITYPVVGGLTTPDFLEGMEPLVVVPQGVDGSMEPLTQIIVVAESPELVVPVAKGVQTVLGVDDPSQVSIETSEQLATLRTLIRDQLASFTRALALVMLAVSGTLVAIVLYGLVMMRRRDFGRRRALGASRGWIVLLLVVQTWMLATVGALLGTGASVIALRVAGDPLPDAEFFGAVAILAVFSSIVAALVPATIAGWRDPIRELRVP